MSKPYLVIVESPGKIKKLKAILGTNYEIVASMGHVVDLPRTAFGIDLTTMQPDYAILKADVAKRLRTEAQKPYKIIYLASDPDREGEAISFHVASLLRRAKTAAKLERVTFDAITPSAVKAAFAAPRAINPQLVAAQEARRLLDRLVGFPASRFLWQFVKGKGLSAGRVQSVALRLVVERDRAIETFIPEEYWTITALFKAAGGDFTARLTTWQGQKAVLKNKAEAEAVLTALKGVTYAIQSVTPKQRQQTPAAPFTTSSMQQAASSHLKLPPDMTMKLAQQLYEAGHITYMRTDSPTVSPEGAAMAKKTIEALYGANYVGHRTYGAKGSAQEAHECIRPTDTSASPDDVRLALGSAGGRAAALYELIWKRFLASQMANAVFDEVHVKVAGGAAVFSAKGSRLAFDGFLRVYNFTDEKEQAKRADAPDEDADETPVNKTLPPLKVGEGVQALKLTPAQHFTQPPAPYTEALLVKALEQNGVGRPSTYAQTIATIKKRGYVALEKRKLAATTLGKQVHTVLDTRLKGLFETAFTAQMEASLDQIAAGQTNGRDYLRGFWAQVSPLFGESVIAATLAPRETKPRGESKTDLSHTDTARRVPPKSPRGKRRTPRKTSTPLTPDPDASSPASPPTRGEGRQTRRNVSSATAAQETPASSTTASLPPLIAALTEGIEVVCPKCGRTLVERHGPRGGFWGCSGFPRCRFTKPLA